MWKTQNENMVTVELMWWVVSMQMETVRKTMANEHRMVLVAYGNGRRQCERQ
jgi:hypothetical protein